MAVDLLGRAFTAPSAAGEHLAFQEAAAAGLRSLELLASSLSPAPQAEQQHQPLGQIADQAVSRFRRVINLLDRTGHARFRRAPAVVQPESPPASPRPAPAPAVAPLKSLTLDFTKPATKAAKAQPAVSATSTSFLSSVTAGGEGSVSKGQSLAVSSGKPPLPKRKHPCSAAAPNAAAAATAPSAAASGGSRADIPADEWSWRKYGQKPIKGSPFPRGYYRCSSVKGCPARKHVERDAADPATLIVTYEADHRHDAAALKA